jgi:hypothetical protein
MEQILAIVNYIKANWVDICTVVTSIIGVASIVVKLTPSLKDDTVLQKIVAFVGKYIALNKTVLDKDRPK